jgi:hypothetical protein
MVGCIFSLMRGKMNTKRLVLGFCALAAVTGEFWGNEASGGFLADSAAETLRKEFGVWDGLRPLVFENLGLEVLSDVRERQSRYENELNATDERIANERAALARMRKEEIDHVRNALSLEHQAHFRKWIAIETHKKVFKDASLKRVELTIALKEAIGELGKLWFFELRAKRKARAKISELESQLEEACAPTEAKALALQKCKSAYEKAVEETSEAERSRYAARGVHKQRIECFEVIVSDHINERGNVDREADCRILGSPDCDIEQREKIIVSALKDDIVWVALQCGDEEKEVTDQIERIIRNYKNKGWYDYIVDDDLDLRIVIGDDLAPRIVICDGIGDDDRPRAPAPYTPALGYNFESYADQFGPQIDRVNTVFGEAEDVLEATRSVATA